MRPTAGPTKSVMATPKVIIKELIIELFKWLTLQRYNGCHSVNNFNWTYIFKYLVQINFQRTCSI